MFVLLIAAKRSLAQAHYSKEPGDIITPYVIRNKYGLNDLIPLPEKLKIGNMSCAEFQVRRVLLEINWCMYEHRCIRISTLLNTAIITTTISTNSTISTIIISSSSSTSACLYLKKYSFISALSMDPSTNRVVNHYFWGSFYFPPGWGVFADRYE